MFRIWVISLAVLGISLSTLATASTTASAVALLKEYHGGAGPWAAAGYRMGERALKDFGEKKNSFAIDITHRSPAKVQYSCIADGIQSVTGSSVGKMNLRWEKVAMEDLSTIAVHRPTGRRLRFLIRPAFLKAMLDVPHDHLEAKAIEVLQMKEDEIYEVIDDTAR